MTMLGFIAYGITQDQITARVSIEYFTIGHVRILDTENPTIIALLWGVLATWWFGLGAGILLAIVSNFGSWQIMTWRMLIKPAGIFFVGVGITALIAGIIGYVTGEMGIFHLAGRIAAQITPEKQTRFLANGWAHTAAYMAGAIGTIILAIWILWQRRLMSI